MTLQKKPSIVCGTLLAFLLYSLTACTSSRPATELAKYDSYEYADQASFNRPYRDTYRAAVAALEEMGFTITLTDEPAGSIQAEDGTRELRSEETGRITVKEEEDDDGGAGVFAAIVAVLIAIVIFFSGGDDENDVPMEHTRTRMPQKLHVYVVALAFDRETVESTVVTVGASRYDYEDEDLVGQVTLENKYLNHSLFDRIENHLRQSEQPPSADLPD